MTSSNKSMLPVSTLLLLLLLLSLSSSSAFLTPTAVRLGPSSTSLRRASCPVRMMAGGVAAADLEADKKIVKRVAMEKEGELQEVLAAVKRLETAGRQMKDEAENLKMLEKLTGKWRLICTTGDKSGSKITGGKLSYFPIKAVQEFDTTSSPMFIQNGVYLGPLSFEFRGEMELFPKMRRLEFFFNKVRSV